MKIMDELWSDRLSSLLEEWIGRLSHPSGGFRFSEYDDSPSDIGTCYACLIYKLCQIGCHERANMAYRYLEAQILRYTELVKTYRENSRERYQALQWVAYMCAIMGHANPKGIPQILAMIDESYVRCLFRTIDWSRMWYHSNEIMALGAILVANGCEDGLRIIFEELEGHASPLGMVGYGSAEDQFYGFAHFGPLYRYCKRSWPLTANLQKWTVGRHKVGSNFSTKIGVCEELDAVEIYDTFLGGVPDWYKERLVDHMYRNIDRRGGGHISRHILTLPFSSD